MAKELAKQYDPSEVEDRTYKFWCDKKYFHAKREKNKKTYTIVIPPPNITGQLHMGHALDNTLQDILVRYHRMAGYDTLWLPGTDHASIATEAKIVEAMRKEGITKDDLGREKFLERAWDWKKQYGGRIIEQLKKMGSSCDWDRERFTLDEGCSKAVREVFVGLYEKGLIYRGNRMVNWCPHCNTSISDAEVEYEEKDSNFWHLLYEVKETGEKLELATTRPETMLGDTAVAINGDDPRYKHLHGCHVILPLLNKEIPIVCDEHADMTKGTGVVKITPAHDPNDFEVGLRHNLPIIRTFTYDGHMTGKADKEAADEMLDYKGTGMSVMEMSHRSKAFDDIIKEAEKDIRDLMGIPDNYKVLFLQGGASQQFSAVPMNLMKNKKAAYIITGQWAKKAYQEAQKYGEAVAVASSADKTFSYIPDCSDLDIPEDADYVYICENNTIYGTKYKTLPNTKGHTLVADVSSCFLSEPVDVTKYGVIYGGVQKNVGPAGVVIAIIREDLITDDVLEGTPTMLKWKTQADADSLYNTPPCYGIYICGKVFKWIKKMGGLEAMKAHNEKKAKILYDYLDQSKLFKGTVVPEDRSLMNVPFVTGDAELDKKFVAEATAAGFVNLKGHRTVGGMRASIYNAMPIEGVEKLVEFMKKFEAENA